MDTDNEGSKLEIDFKDNSLARSLFGEHHSNLRLIEKVFPVKLSAVGAGVTIDGPGDAIREVAALLSSLSDLQSSGYRLSPFDVERGASILKDKPGTSLKEIFIENIYVSPQKRVISPKSINQKRYTDAIRKNDIVFGIGPAGTGKTYLAIAMAVAALQITLLAGDLTDLRFSSWMDGTAGVRRGTLPHQALTVEPWVIVQTGGITTPDPDTKQATFEIRYPDGDPWDGTFPLDVIVQCYTSSDTIGSFAAGVYEPSNGTISYFPTVEMDEGLPTDMILFPFTGVENNGPSASINVDAGMGNGRMRGSVTAQEFKLEIGRDTGTTPAASVLMAVYPAGAPGDASPTAAAAFAKITFV